MDGSGDFFKQGHTKQSKELEFIILLSHSFEYWGSKGALPA